MLSTDPISDATRPGPVSHTTSRTGDRRLVDITIDTDGRAGAATGRITATENHRFWVADSRAWVPAASLAGRSVVADQRRHLGSGHLHERPGPAHDQLQPNRQRPPAPTTYSLRGTPVLVHNDDPCKLALGMREYGTRELARTVGATHFLDLPGESWMFPVMRAIENASTGLYVNLKGFTGTTPAEQFMRAVLAAVRGSQNGTEKEMRWIAEAVYSGKREWNT